MRLRTRLFLYVGLIFFLAFGISLIFETYSTDKNLTEAEEALRKEILQANEKKRDGIDKFLHVALSRDQAEIDSLLLRISRDPRLGYQLFLEAENTELAAVAHSSFLFKNDRWIDLIQTTKNGELTSLLIPIAFPMGDANEVPIDKNLSWVVLQDDPNHEKPLIGVRFVPDPDEKRSLSYLVDELLEIDWGLLVLFDPKALLDFKATPVRSEAEETVEDGVDLSSFVKNVTYASDYLKKRQQFYSSPDWITKDLASKSHVKHFSGESPESGIHCLTDEGHELNTRIIQLMQRGDQAMMISSLGSLFPDAEFGDSLFSPTAPKGIARFSKGFFSGNALLTEKAFFQHKIYDDDKYFQDHPPFTECPDIASSIAVIADAALERVFVGNALELINPTTKKREGFLTVGIDVDSLLEDLVLSVHQIGFIVHQNEVVVALTEDARKISNPKEHMPFEKEILTKKTGIIQWGKESYYFLHITPFDDLDLHFIILEPEKEAFALINSLDEGSREVIDKVAFNMRTISLLGLALVLISLHFVARKITRPITSLAQVTEDVAAGKLEGIELPDATKNRKDEIASLCHSFNEMVIGLREKEKVKGVLNKVVSPEIAQEITQGNIHLGGETKKVTVLFADIRGFTAMSAGMSPEKVVELLNNCMTLISHLVDEFGGVIDKYVGDEVMALYGAPIASEDSALKAVQSGLKMVEALKKWNQERQAKGESPVEMGIGIHTGDVLVGNMGAENRLNYTVIGSNVNLAARLCSAAEAMEVRISEGTLAEPHVRENITVEELPPVQLKGFDKEVTTYRVTGGKNV